MKVRLLKSENGAIHIRDWHNIEHRFETPDGDGCEWLDLFRELKDGQVIMMIFEKCKEKAGKT